MTACSALLLCFGCGAAEILGLDGIKEDKYFVEMRLCKGNVCWWFGYAMKSDIVLRRMCSSLNGILC